MKKHNIKFKTYDQTQLMLLPPSLDDFIPMNHPSRVVAKIIDEIDIDPLIQKYQGGGCSSYHPRMLLKVLVYGYLNNIYSSRKLEASVQENIYFMWLTGMSKPDHNTINRFRSDRLKGVLQHVFKQVVLLLADAGLIDLRTAYIDGTKLEANANRFTFVWGNAIKTNKERIVKQLNELWDYAQAVAAEELKDTRPTGFDQVNPDAVEKTITAINEALKDKPIKKKVHLKLKYAEKNWPKALKKYQEQEAILKGRNSYSKTDTDATFMRMKEDYMQNGQLKPGYNWQISTNNQYILNYTLHPNPTDTLTLIPHLNHYKNLYGFAPTTITADAGYGSEENYKFAEENQVEAFVKYSYFHKEQKSKNDNPFATNNLFYNAQTNTYYCPMGQKMAHVGTRKHFTANGYEQTSQVYEAANCNGCPLRGQCHKAKGNRRIEVNHSLSRLKLKAKELLLSEEGIKHRKKRPADVEAVFGNIKSNHHFKRLMLRGKMKVEIEVGLLSIAHNLRKMAAR